MRVMTRVWHWYLKNLDAHPLATKTGMTLVLMGVADSGAQYAAYKTAVAAASLPGAAETAPAGNGAGGAGAGLTGPARTPLDIVPALTQPSGTFSLDMERQRSIWAYAMFQGPFGHWWFDFLDRTAMRVAKQYTLPFKIVCDQIVNATLSNVVYLSLVPWLEGRADSQWVLRKLRLDLLPTYVIDCAFWPVCMYFNFKYAPVKHQLLVANVCVLVWSIFMSFVCHDDSLLRSLDFLNPSPYIQDDIDYLTKSEKEFQRKEEEARLKELEEKAR